MQKNPLDSSGSCEQVLGWEDELNRVAEHSPGKLLNHKPQETGRFLVQVSPCACPSDTLPQAVATACSWNWESCNVVWPCSYSDVICYKVITYIYVTCCKVPCAKREVIPLFTLTGISFSRGQSELLLIASDLLTANLSSLGTIPGVYLNPFFFYEVNQTKGLLHSVTSFWIHHNFSGRTVRLCGCYFGYFDNDCPFFCISTLSLHYEPIS